VELGGEGGRHLVRVRAELAAATPQVLALLGLLRRG